MTAPALPIPNPATAALLQRLVALLALDVRHTLDHNDPTCPTCRRVADALALGITGRAAQL